jgi:hypothetical protein
LVITGPVGGIPVESFLIIPHYLNTGVKENQAFVPLPEFAETDPDLRRREGVACLTLKIGRLRD